jgi:uncharacterized membrane protein (DUF4010 family)
MFLRILLIVGVLNQAMLPSLTIPMGIMAFACFAGAGVLWLDRSAEGMANPALLPNPFDLGTALKFGLFIAVVLVLSHLFQQWYGNQGLYVLAALSGLADVDAISVAMTRLAAQTPALTAAATTGVVIAAFVNTMVKAGIAFVLCGGTMAWRVMAVFAVSIAVGVAALALG